MTAHMKALAVEAVDGVPCLVVESRGSGANADPNLDPLVDRSRPHGPGGGSRSGKARSGCAARGERGGAGRYAPVACGKKLAEGFSLTALTPQLLMVVVERDDDLETAPAVQTFEFIDWHGAIRLCMIEGIREQLVSSRLSTLGRVDRFCSIFIRLRGRKGAGGPGPHHGELGCAEPLPEEDTPLRFGVSVQFFGAQGGTFPSSM